MGSFLRASVLARLLVLVLLTAHATFAQECYYAVGKKAGSAIIPCKDPRLGVTWCCQTGDICLSDLACWNEEFNVTYQYGCTDSTYQDDMCPEKCHLDVEKAHWIGLIYCREPSKVWACHHPDTCGNCLNPNTFLPAIQSLPAEGTGCTNLKQTLAAFAGPTVLRPSVWLPAEGTETTYFSHSGTTDITISGYTPAWATSTETTQRETSSQPSATSNQPSTTSSQPSKASSQPSETSSQSSETSSQPIQTSNQPNETSSQPNGASSEPSRTSETSPESLDGTASPNIQGDEEDPSSSGGLSIGAKVGIGVSASIVGLVALGALAVIVMRKRRKAADPGVGGYYSPGYKPTPSSLNPSSTNRMSELPTGFPSEVSSPNPNQTMGARSMDNGALGPAPTYQNLMGQTQMPMHLGEYENFYQGQQTGLGWQMQGEQQPQHFQAQVAPTQGGQDHHRLSELPAGNFHEAHELPVQYRQP